VLTNVRTFRLFLAFGVPAEFPSRKLRFLVNFEKKFYNGKNFQSNLQGGRNRKMLFAIRVLKSTSTGEGWGFRFFMKGDGQKTHSRAEKKDYENYITKK
jgi:hypothetical protein